MMEVSIIVPIYNGEKFINKCVGMILNQTFSSFELILVNDGSTDNSKTICDELAFKDTRIKVINKENGGAWTARNFGIDYAKGKYIMFLDCDDWYDKNLLKEMHDRITTVDLVICGQTDIVINGKKIRYDTSIPNKYYYENRENFLKNYITLREEHVAETLWNKMYRLDLINRFNIRFKDFKRGEDVIFNLDYFEKLNSCKVINKSLYYYRVDSCNPWWIKYSQNLYNVILGETEQLKQRLIQWNIYNNHAAKHVATHFIGGIIGYLYWIFYPNNNFTLKEKYMKILDILNKNTVKEYLKICKGNKKFEKIIVQCMKRKNIVLILIFIKLKIIIKKVLNYN
ncbi:glycosyltransferase family 2 protein [Clostridium botulinum]|nr:glycosyltransferase family 2 protein [Clostridium botulinum]